MLIVDGEPLNLDKPVTKTEKWVVDQMKDIQTMKSIRFERGYTHDAAGLLEPPMTRWQWKAIKKNENGINQNWLYTTEQPTEKDGKRYYVANNANVGIDLTVDPKENIELAFFSYSVMRRQIGMMGYKLMDYERDARMKNKKAMQEVHVQHIVYTELSDDELRLRAYAWGLANVEEQSVEMLKQDLIAKVFASEKNKAERGIKEFIAEANEQSDTLTLSAYVNKAFEDKIIGLNKHKTKVTYLESDMLLCSIPPTKLANHKGYVVSFLQREKDSKEGFLAAMEGTLDTIAGAAKDYKNVRNVPSLKKMAKEWDIIIPVDVKTADEIHKHFDKVFAG